MKRHARDPSVAALRPLITGPSASHESAPAHHFASGLLQLFFIYSQSPARPAQEAELSSVRGHRLQSLSARVSPTTRPQAQSAQRQGNERESQSSSCSSPPRLCLHPQGPHRTCTQAPKHLVPLRTEPSVPPGLIFDVTSCQCSSASPPHLPPVAVS